MAREIIQQLQAKHSIYGQEAQVGLDVRIYFHEVVLEQYFARGEVTTQDQLPEAKKSPRDHKVPSVLLTVQHTSSLHGFHRQFL